MDTMKNFGFGCMRLPMKDEEVDIAAFSAMVDLFLENGLTYFDTAHGYISGKSETAIRESLTKRYSRDRYILTDKLTANYFDKEEDIRPVFQSQLEACGVSYFDYYLMHAQGTGNYDHFKRCRAYETAFALKAEGKVKHVGLSFHDKATLLEQILTEYPQVEVVQIQYNYIDAEDPVVEGNKCLEICRRHGKPVIVMEPVRGGTLSNLPEDARSVLTALHGGSPASYAIRYAAGAQGVFMVLSGMSNLEQMQDNISFMKAFRPLSETELAAVRQVREMMRSKGLIACTACRYCVDDCPQHIVIPDLFACMNSNLMSENGITNYYYNEVCTKNGGKASSCIQCGSCETVCPQHLPIRELLVQVAGEFEK